MVIGLRVLYYQGRGGCRQFLRAVESLFLTFGLHNLTMAAPRFISAQISFSVVLVLGVAALTAGAVRADTGEVRFVAEQSVRGQRGMPSSSSAPADCRPFLIEGTARSKGLVGKFFMAVDPRRRTATLQVTDTGPADFAFGVSGARAWVKDAGGIVSDADFAGYRAGIASDAYWLSGGISNPCWPANITSLGTGQINGTTADKLSVSPQGGKVTTAWISRATHRPLSWSRRDEPDVASTTYSDYRRVGDHVMPFRQRIVDRDGNQWDLRAVRVQTGAASDRVDERVQKPVSLSSDHWIDGGDTTTIPMDGSGKPRVNVFINGKGPFSFLFDSGGALMMSRAAADAAGLKLFGKGQETGITGAATTMRFAKIGDLRIGAAHLRDQFVSVRDGDSNGVDPQDAGLIGYEVLARFTTTFDFPKRTISLSLKPGEATAGGSAASAIALDHTVPVVAGSMNGVADYFWLDTGFNGALLVNRTFGIAHPTALPERLYDIGGSLSAVGGGSAIKAGRISSVTIGTMTFADVVGMFSSVDGGLNTDAEFAADVGDALLGSCVVTFDYKARRLWIAQSDVPGSPLPSSYNRAGFGIEYANSGMASVSYVRESSPADEVGLREGDRVIGIDGGEVSGAVVAAIRSRLRTRDDAPIRLTVLRAGSVLDLAVQPKDYVQ